MLNVMKATFNLFMIHVLYPGHVPTQFDCQYDEILQPGLSGFYAWIVIIFHHFIHYKFIILRVVFKLFDWIDEKVIKESPLRILKGEKTTTTPIPQ